MSKPIGLPPRFESKEITRAAAHTATMRRELQEAVNVLHAVEGAVADARERDKAEYAASIEAGKDYDPSAQPHTDRAERDLLAARRRLEATEEAVASADSKLIAVVKKERSAELAALEKLLPAHRKRFLDALDALVDAQAALAEANGRVSWLKRFPDQTHWNGSAFSGTLHSLKDQSGAPHVFSNAAAAMREIARPPDPPREQRGSRPLRPAVSSI